MVLYIFEEPVLKSDEEMGYLTRIHDNIRPKSSYYDHSVTSESFTYYQISMMSLNEYTDCTKNPNTLNTHSMYTKTILKRIDHILGMATCFYFTCYLITGTLPTFLGT